jgi:DnaJ-class molecular chaperone
MDRDQLRQNPKKRNTDEVPEGTPDAAENICRRCAGSGRIDGGECGECGGTGKVFTPVGGAG